MGWRETIRRERHTVGLVLSDSPSLMSQVGPLATAMFDEAAAWGTASLAEHGEPYPAALDDKAVNADLVDNVVNGNFIPEHLLT